MYTSFAVRTLWWSVLLRRYMMQKGNFSAWPVAMWLWQICRPNSMPAPVINPPIWLRWQRTERCCWIQPILLWWVKGLPRQDMTRSWPIPRSWNPCRRALISTVFPWLTIKFPTMPPAKEGLPLRFPCSWAAAITGRCILP